MNRRSVYDQANWKLSDVQLAKRWGVTKQAVAAARKVRGIASPVGHGGKRKGAGAKRKLRPSAKRYDWAAADWAMNNQEIAKMLGASPVAVLIARRRLGAPKSPGPKLAPDPDWSKVDWTRPVREIRRLVKKKTSVVIEMGRKFGGWKAGRESGFLPP